MNTDALVEMRACKEAVEWAAAQKSAAQAWRDCERGDWMLWLLGRLSGKPGSKKRKRLVLCACECARLSLKYVPKGEDRPRKAIETAEAWARGEGPTIEDVRAAGYAAADAGYAAAYAAYAADDAAYAAYAAAYAAAAAYTADAADAAADAAAHAAYAASLEGTLRQCADIVRKHYPTPPRLGNRRAR